MSDRTPNHKNLRVVIDGSHKLAAITDAETGEPFPVRALKIEWDIETCSPVLTVETYHFEADVTGKAQVIRLCPGCQKERDEQRGPVKPPPPPPAPPKR